MVKYTTQSSVSPEDTIITATQQLTSALKGNARGNHEELEALTKVADLSEEIARDKASTEKQGKLTGNGIQQYADASPRVENSESPRVPNRLVVACQQLSRQA